VVVDPAGQFGLTQAERHTAVFDELSKRDF
jgi:hypothetical protein